MRKLTVALSFAGLTIFSTSTAASDWPQLQFSAGRSGFNPNERAINTSNVRNLVVDWRMTFDAGLTAPVLAGGRLYVGSRDGKLYAIDAAQGTVLWSGATGASIVFSPAVQGDRVVVGSDDGNVYAFPTSCSTPCVPLWIAATRGRISSSPAIADGAIYIGAGRLAEGDLWSFDLHTGGTRWLAELTSAPTTPAVANGIVYTTGGGLHAFPTSCSSRCFPMWSASSVSAPPAVAEGVVYVDSGFLNVFNAFAAACTAPCFPVWTAFTESAAFSGPAVANGIAYNAQLNGVLQAFSVGCSDQCSPIWTARPGGSLAAQNLDSSPAVANGVLYVGVTVINEPGRLYALNAATGVLLADFEVGGLVSSPVIADGAVYVASNPLSGGRLTRFGLTTRNVLHLESPNTPSRWGVATKRRIAWTYSGDAPQFLIEISRDSGTTWTDLATVPNRGGNSQNFDWQVTGPLTSAAKFRVTAMGDPEASDINDTDIRIAKATIEILTPKQTTSIALGSPLRIFYKHSLGAGAPVVIEVSANNGGTWRSLVETATKGSTTSSFVWAVDFLPTTKARVRIRALDGSGARSAWSRAFRVTPPAAVNGVNSR